MSFFFRFIYPVLYTLLLAGFLPFYVLRSRARKKPSAPWLERMGRLPSNLENLSPSKDRVWIHAVSVGEVNVIRPLIDKLALPAERLFVSTTTPTGQHLAQQLFGQRAQVFYFPFDWRLSCRRYLRRIRPAHLVLAESELWPGFIETAASEGYSLVLVNGRISDRSFGRYQKFRLFCRPLLSRFSALCMQTREDKHRIIEIGAIPDRVFHTGNLKYDYSLEPKPEIDRLVSQLEAILKPAAEHLLWVCGSTREGEEELLAKVYEELTAEFPQLNWLLAPRHPNRAQEVLDVLAAAGLPAKLRSQLDTPDIAEKIIILDSIGELAHLYSLADVVFVGGSLFPTGGHNIIEAANFSKPILFGPHMENFAEIAETFLDAYGALQVGSAQELPTKIRELLRDAASRKWLGRNARRVIRDNRGAVERTAEIIGNAAGREGSA